MRNIFKIAISIFTKTSSIDLFPYSQSITLNLLCIRIIQGICADYHYI